VTDSAQGRPQANLTGNISGGVNAALVSFPKNIAYGALVFAPLGPDYYSIGLLSGLASFIFINIITTFYYGNKLLSSGPSSLVSIMLASSVALIAKNLADKGEMTQGTVLAFFFLLVAMVSFSQMLLGLLRAGELTKYIPYPVISGIANGGAVLILLSQSSDLLGVSSPFSMQNIPAFLSEISVPLLCTGLSICCALALSKKFLKKVPDTIIGILFGAAVFYTVRHFYPGTWLGGTVGLIPFSPGDLAAISQFERLFSWDIYLEHMDLCQQLIGPAISIAIVVSLNCLLAQSVSDNLLNTYSMSNRELVAQSFGNFTALVPSLRAGSGAYFTLTGTPDGPQLLHVRSEGGGLPFPQLRIAIVRTQ